MNKKITFTIEAIRYTFCPKLAAITAEYGLPVSDCYRTAGKSVGVITADTFKARKKILETVTIW